MDRGDFYELLYEEYGSIADELGESDDVDFLRQVVQEQCLNVLKG